MDRDPAGRRWAEYENPVEPEDELDDPEEDDEEDEEDEVARLQEETPFIEETVRTLS